MSGVVWPAPAKINLFLHVTGRRADGYHLLQTLFQFLEIGDEIEIEVRTDGAVKLSADVDGVEAHDNLVVKAAKRLKQESCTTLGANITVRKHLPMGGGLGGGACPECSKDA